MSFYAGEDFHDPGIDDTAAAGNNSNAGENGGNDPNASGNAGNVGQAADNQQQSLDHPETAQPSAPGFEYQAPGIPDQPPTGNGNRANANANPYGAGLAPMNDQQPTPAEQAAITGTAQSTSPDVGTPQGAAALVGASNPNLAANQAPTAGQTNPTTPGGSSPAIDLAAQGVNPAMRAQGGFTSNGANPSPYLSQDANANYATPASATANGGWPSGTGPVAGATPPQGTGAPGGPQVPGLNLNDQQWQDQFQNKFGFYDPRYNGRESFLHNAQLGDTTILPQLEQMAQVDGNAARVLNDLKSLNGGNLNPGGTFYDSQLAQDWNRAHQAADQQILGQPGLSRAATANATADLQRTQGYAVANPTPNSKAFPAANELTQNLNAIDPRYQAHMVGSDVVWTNLQTGDARFMSAKASMASWNDFLQASRQVLGQQQAQAAAQAQARAAVVAAPQPQYAQAPARSGYSAPAPAHYAAAPARYAAPAPARYAAPARSTYSAPVATATPAPAPAPTGTHTLNPAYGNNPPPGAQNVEVLPPSAYPYDQEDYYPPPSAPTIPDPITYTSPTETTGPYGEPPQRIVRTAGL